MRVPNAGNAMSTWTTNLLISAGVAIILGSIHLTRKRIMDELANLTTEVAETRTVMDSAVVLIQGLKAKLDAAGTDPVKLKALSDSLDAGQQSLAAAIAANTPAEPPADTGGTGAGG